MIKELITLAEIELLTGNGSQKEKQRLISENLTEEMLYILDVCFNPFVTTKLHKLEMNNGFFGMPSVSSDFPGFQIFKDLVEDLKKSTSSK